MRRGFLLISLIAACVLLLSASDKTRVFITDSKSWDVTGGFVATDDVASGAIKGGARPQTAEILKTFGERCPKIAVTIKQAKANYIVLLDHEGGKGALRKDNKVAVFNKEGDMIHSGSTRSLGNAVKDACKAIMKDATSETK